jgi:DNA-binding IscR family transcriptional regulator
VTLADIIRALEGPLANIRGQRPENALFPGPAAPLQQVWIAVRSNLRSVLEHVTLADVAGNGLPEAVQRLSADPDAWAAH